MIGETRCRVLCADPPWIFSDRLPGATRGAAKNYRVLTLPQICAFHLPPFEMNAWLFLWRVSSQVEAAYTVARAWGFTPKTEIVWRKTTATGKAWFGMGHYLRAAHETCIVAVRGSVRPKVRNERSVFEAPAGRHSEKPEAFYDLVERLTDGPFVELFSRRRRPGWFCFGDEIGVEETNGDTCNRALAPASSPSRAGGHERPLGGPQSDLDGDVPPDPAVADLASDGVAGLR